MIVRVDGPTPRGGAYTLAVHLDREGREVAEVEDAVEVIVGEYSADGTWLGETVLVRREGGDAR